MESQQGESSTAGEYRFLPREKSRDSCSPYRQAALFPQLPMVSFVFALCNFLCKIYHLGGQGPEMLLFLGAVDRYIQCVSSIAFNLNTFTL